MSFLTTQYSIVHTQAMKKFPLQNFSGKSLKLQLSHENLI